MKTNFITKYGDVIKYPWKTRSCGQATCWCLMIVPAQKLIWKGDESEVCVIGGGGVDKVTAKHLVKLHNASLKGQP